MTPDIDWRERYREQLRCEAAGHARAFWARRVTQQATHVQFFCDTCERPVTNERYPLADGRKRDSVTAEWLRDTLGIDADELPEVRRSLRYELCYLCGVTALCEWHHVAPQALYGSDADRYPIVALCAECHAQETRSFTERLERYVQERIRRYLAKRGDAA
jgi:hypothetical protein